MAASAEYAGHNLGVYQSIGRKAREARQPHKEDDDRRWVITTPHSGTTYCSDAMGANAVWQAMCKNATSLGGEMFLWCQGFALRPAKIGETAGNSDGWWMETLTRVVTEVRVEHAGREWRAPFRSEERARATRDAGVRVLRGATWTLTRKGLFTFEEKAISRFAITSDDEQEKETLDWAIAGGKR